MPDANLVRSVMYLLDCYMDDFQDEKYIGNTSDLELRAQIEVNYIKMPKVVSALLKILNKIFCTILGLLFLRLHLGNGQYYFGSVPRKI